MPDLYKVKSFSDRASQGNLAGVVTNAIGLSDEEMQSIAKLVDASETAFILPSSTADLRIRWFTPNTEVGICVHATVAALGVLQALGDISKEIIRVETKNTILVCHLRANNIFINISDYQLMSKTALDPHILSLLTLSLSQIVNTPGIVKILEDYELVVEVGSFDDLRQLQPMQEKYSAVCSALKVTGISIFTRETLHPNNQVHFREFAPDLGYFEDPLCGMASGAIYTYLGTKQPLHIEQGYFCNTSGIILVEPGDDNTVWVGGTYCINEHIPDIDITSIGLRAKL